MGPGEQSELSGSPGPESSPGVSPGVTLLFSSPGDPLRGLLPETSPSWPQACSRPGLAVCYKKVIFGWMGSWLQQAGVLALWRAGAALQPWSTGCSLRWLLLQSTGPRGPVASSLCRD